MRDLLQAEGVYDVVCTSNGQVKWHVSSPNLVTIVGANLMLDCAFSGASPGTAFAGLITNTNFGSINQTDTMGSKGWTESNCYGTVRPLVVWQSANSGKKVWSRAVQFVTTRNDKIDGCFLLFGPAASQSVLDGHGTLWSATTFFNGSQTVQAGDVISVQYATSLIRIASTVNNFQVLIAELGRAMETAGVQAPIFIDNEVLRAVDANTEIFSFHLPFRETGLSVVTALGVVTYPISFAIVLDIISAQSANYNYVVAVSEILSAASTQDGNLFVVHEVGNAASTQVGNAAYPVTLAEFSPVTRTSQTVTIGYAVSLAEADNSASTQTAHATYPVFVFESGNSIVTTDASFGNFVLDDAGNFVLDDSGNKILIG